MCDPTVFPHPTDQLPVTITASIGDDACLPCSTHPWGHLRGVILSCTHHNGTHHPIPVLRHRLGWLPPEPGWSPPEEPDNRFRGRVSFCAGGPGEAGLALLLRNLSDPDFGNYSCYVAGAAPPQLLCSLVLQRTAGGEWSWCWGGGSSTRSCRWVGSALWGSPRLGGPILSL